VRNLRLLLYSLLLSFPLVFGMTWTVQAGTITPTLDTARRDLGPDEEVPVIIYLSDKVDIKKIKDKNQTVRSAKIIKSLIDKANATQKDIIKQLKAGKAKKILSLWGVNGIAARIPVAMIDSIASQPGIDRVALDAEITLPPEISPADAGTGGTATAEWNLDLIRAPDLWALGYDGNGVVVAIMDTGVDLNHPDIAAKYRGGTNSWFDPHGEHATPGDLSGHGTWVTGLVVGGDYGGTAIGVAPGARWIAVKIFNDAGVAALSDIHAGFQWLLDPNGDLDPEDAPDIVNNSWYLGGTVNACDTYFAADIDTLRATGIAVVFSSGNTGPGTDTSVSPANNAGSLAVGAAGEVGGYIYIADFSGRGPSACDGGIYPRITAPGDFVRTTDLTAGGWIPGSYKTVSGTSFAAPHIAGGMALLLGAMESRGTPVTVSELEMAVTESALAIGATSPNDDAGYGLLDAAAAYDWLLAYTAPPLPDVEPDGDVDGSDLSAFSVAPPPGLDLPTFAENFGKTPFP